MAKSIRLFFAEIAQAMTRRHNVTLHAVFKVQTQVTAGGFLG